MKLRRKLMILLSVVLAVTMWAETLTVFAQESEAQVLELQEEVEESVQETETDSNLADLLPDISEGSEEVLSDTEDTVSEETVTDPAETEPTGDSVVENTDPEETKPAGDSAAENTDPAETEPAGDSVAENTDPAETEPAGDPAAENTDPAETEPAGESAEGNPEPSEAEITGDKQDLPEEPSSELTDGGDLPAEDSSEDIGVSENETESTSDQSETEDAEEEPETEEDLELADVNAPEITGISEGADGYGTITWKAVAGASCYKVYRKNGNEWDYCAYADATETQAGYIYFNVGENILCVTVCDSYDNEYGYGTNTVSYIYLPDGDSCTAYIYDKVNATNTTHEFELFNIRPGAGIKIYRRISGGSWETIKTITAEALKDKEKVVYSYIPPKSGTYEYRYRFYYGTKYGKYSTIRKLYYLAAPEVISVSGNNCKVTVKLKDNTAVSHFRVYLRNDTDEGVYHWFDTADANKTITINFTDIGVHYNADFKLSVQSENNQTYSTESAAINVVNLTKPRLSGSVKTTADTAAITWGKQENVSRYEIYRYDAASKQYTLLTTVKGTAVQYLDTSVKADTGYTYKIRAKATRDGNVYYSDYSKTVTVYTLPTESTIAEIQKKVSSGKPLLLVQSQIMSNCLYGYGKPAPISDFIDYKGCYTVAFATEDQVIISRIDTDTMKVVGTVKIAKEYPALGGVTCDGAGNYYLAWGQTDVQEVQNMVTFAVSKYSYSGKYLGTAVSYGSKSDTKAPFTAGNCAMTINGDVLVCSYGRLMYKSSDGLNHQSNEVFCVNIQTMKETDSFNCYTSHSFDQKLTSLGDGGFASADLGDAYSRGFEIVIQSGDRSEVNVVPFHFYGSLGNNSVGASLGGIGEVSTGVALVGTSVKSMNSLDGKQQLFMQILNEADGSSVLSGSKRSGTCCDVSQTDVGIKWLTDYTDGSYAASPHMSVLDKDRILVMWIKYKDYQPVNTYYMILSASGTVIQGETPVGQKDLNTYEELKYYQDHIFWSNINGSDLIVNKLNVANPVFLKKGWNKAEGYWYYSDGTNVVTGWKKYNGVWYLLRDPDGRMLTGWQKVKGKWYYMNPDGIMQTGWIQLKNKWYFLDESGAMRTGWKKSGSKWYYLDDSGVMAVGWVKVKGKWYYMNQSGIMQTGWVQVKNKWYYLDADGIMQTGWKKSGGKWYYLQDSGAMAVGWLKISKKWYYFDAKGIMVTGTLKIGSKTYNFDSNGVWVS